MGHYLSTQYDSLLNVSRNNKMVNFNDISLIGFFKIFMFLMIFLDWEVALKCHNSSNSVVVVV